MFTFHHRRSDRELALVTMNACLFGTVVLFGRELLLHHFPVRIDSKRVYESLGVTKYFPTTNHYPYFLGKCLDGLHFLFSTVLSFTDMTFHAPPLILANHSHSLRIPLVKNKFHSNSFLTREPLLCEASPQEDAFPITAIIMSLPISCELLDMFLLIFARSA